MRIDDTERRPTVTARGAGTLRILLVAPPWFSIPPLGYGGIEWIVAMLADGLVDRGHDVTLLASAGSRTRARAQIVFDPPPSELLGDGFVEATHVLEGYRDLDRYDVVLDHSGPVGATVGATAPRPVVHTLHGPWTAVRSRFYRTVGDRLQLVAISQDQAARAPAAVRIAAVIHNAIPVERYPYRADKEDLLAFVGRASREKAPELAVEVARRTGRKLVLCCKVNEPEERAYWDEVVTPCLAGVDVEVFHDATHEVKADVLGRAAALLFPIQWPEPFGLVMAEANACGTPVIAFREGAAAEVLLDGVTGRVVDPGDLDAFTAAVETVSELSPAACRAHVEARFGPERLAAEYEAVLLAAAGQASTGQASTGKIPA
jgi:glycosyltransferase involved in cell wall biosynthesis